MSSNKQYPKLNLAKKYDIKTFVSLFFNNTTIKNQLGGEYHRGASRQVHFNQATHDFSKHNKLSSHPLNENNTVSINPPIKIKIYKNNKSNYYYLYNVFTNTNFKESFGGIIVNQVHNPTILEHKLNVDNMEVIVYGNQADDDNIYIEPLDKLPSINSKSSTRSAEHFKKIAQTIAHNEPIISSVRNLFNNHILLSSRSATSARKKKSIKKKSIKKKSIKKKSIKKKSNKKKSNKKNDPKPNY